MSGARKRPQGPFDRTRAFEMLFRPQTFDAIMRWLARLSVPRQDRHDVLQDILVAVCASFHTYEPARARPERWLNKIVVHVASHYRGRAWKRREVLTDIDPELVCDDSLSAHDLLEGQQARMSLMHLLEGLDASLGTVLIEHDLDGNSMAEISERYGVPISTTYKRRARALLCAQAAAEEKCDEDI